MSLRLKLHLIVGGLSLLFVLVAMALQFEALRETVHEDVGAANRVAVQLLRQTVRVHAAAGTGALLPYLQGLGRVRSTEIVVYDDQLRERYRSPPSPYKAGRSAPVWFERLIVPPPSRQVVQLPDGVLELSANASRSALDAWDELAVLLAGALGMLLVLNLLLAWVLGRTVRPFARIVEGLRQLESGRFDIQLPPLPGREAATIGAAFNRMVGVVGAQFQAEKRALIAEAQLSDSRELARWVDHHVEQERRSIARELHDELGQSVTAVRSLALSIAHRTETSDAESARAARLVADEASRLYDAMQGMIPRLTPLVLDRFGLADALTDLAERTRRSQPHLQIELALDAAGTGLSPDAALALYRAAQEGITNALRHGGADKLHLALRRQGDEVLLELVDNGSGLAADWQDRQGHYGLRWMADRLAALRGRYAIQPVAPHGVALTVGVPAAEAWA
jgi:two-component system sensor histidine kinase UhpB